MRKTQRFNPHDRVTDKLGPASLPGRRPRWWTLALEQAGWIFEAIKKEQFTARHSTCRPIKTYCCDDGDNERKQVRRLGYFLHKKVLRQSKLEVSEFYEKLLVARPKNRRSKIFDQPIPDLVRCVRQTQT